MHQIVNEKRFYQFIDRYSKINTGDMIAEIYVEAFYVGSIFTESDCCCEKNKNHSFVTFGLKSDVVLFPTIQKYLSYLPLIPFKKKLMTFDYDSWMIITIEAKYGNNQPPRLMPTNY